MSSPVTGQGRHGATDVAWRDDRKAQQAWDGMMTLLSGKPAPNIPGKPATHASAGPAGFKSSISATDLEQVSDALCDVFKVDLRAVADSLPANERKAFLEQGAKTFGALFSSAFNPLKARLEAGDRVKLEELVDAARKADSVLVEIRARAVRQRLAEPDKRGQASVAPRAFAMADGKVQVLRAHSDDAIENVVLRGGGAKGIGYLSAILELERAGRLAGLRHLVGTSAGALTAICLACGMTAEEFAAFAGNVESATLPQAIENVSKRYPGVRFGAGLHQAGQALEVLDRVSAQGVANALRTRWPTRAELEDAIAALTDEQLQRAGFPHRLAALDRLESLREPNFGPKSNRSAQLITFGDLRLMHQLAPDRFRELTLTGWDETAKQEAYFSADSAPGMPIAYAGRISMSIPGYFQSVRFAPDGKHEHTYKDGGLGSNVPAEVITGGLEGAALEQANARTLVMVFDDDGEAYRVMHGDSKERLATPSFIDSMVSGSAPRKDALAADRQKIYAAANVHVVFHGDLQSLDVKASGVRQDRARAQATLKSLEQIEQRRNEAYAVVYASEQECFDALTDRERQALLDDGPPDPQDPAFGPEQKSSGPPRTMHPAYRYQQTLYHLAVDWAEAARARQQRDPDESPSR